MYLMQKEEKVVMMERHISEQKEALLRMKKYVEAFKKYGFDYYLVNSFLSDFIPKNEEGQSMVGFHVNSFENDEFYYDPTLKRVNVSLDGLRNHITHNIGELDNLFGLDDKFKFSTYFAMFSMAAEIEKSYEHLIGEGVILAPRANIRVGYKKLFDLFDDSKIEDLNFLQKSRRKLYAFRYLKEAYLHAIDRNANLAAAKLVGDAAVMYGDVEVANDFVKLVNHFQAIGYHRDNKGCFNHTFNDIGMHDTAIIFNKSNNEDFSIAKRIEYGLEIPEKSRELLLK